MKTRILASGALFLAMGAGIAWADSPHFVGNVKAQLVTGPAVQVCFKEAGLGSNTTVNVIASANATALWVCRDNFGNCPEGFQNVTTVVNDSQPFTAGRSGNINGCLTIPAPGAPGFSCSRFGLITTLSRVSWTNIHVTDDTNGDTKVATPASLTATIFRCPGT